MTDQQPGQGPEQRLPVPREPAEVTPAERFTAPPQAHTIGLSAERAAKIVRQSGSSRWVAFLVVSLIAIFVIGYFFYELGVPGIEGSSRMEKETAAQQVTDVERGAALYTANCSRCHGDAGQGGIGPVLNEQAKLLTHLTPQYLETVLTVGGRFICGDPNSLMLAWLEPKGPLNYRQLEELIAFIRAPSTLTYTTEDLETGETTEHTGWRDESYTMPAGATPVPACWKDAFGGGGGSATPAPSGAPTAAPSDGAGRRDRDAQDHARPGSPSTRTPSRSRPTRPSRSCSPTTTRGSPTTWPSTRAPPPGPAVWTGEIFNGVETRTYDVPALPAGTYGFVCTVHPNMTGTLTAK